MTTSKPAATSVVSLSPGRRGALDTLERPNPNRLRVGVALLIAVVLFVLSQAQIHDHIERLNNPNRPNPLPTTNWWLGLSIDFWIPVFYVANAAIMIWFGVHFWRHWKRTGNYHPALPVFVATWLVGHFWEPIGDWATYCSYYPEQPHLREDWPLVDISPTVQPLWILEGAYPVFFLMPAMIGYAAYRRFVQKRARNPRWTRSWPARHPCTTVFVIALGIGLVADIIMESWMMNIGVYKYTQVPPGFVLNWGKSHLHFAEIFFMALVMAAKGVLLYRDDQGRNACEEAIGSLPGLRLMNASFAKKTIIAGLATAFVLVAYGAYFGAYRIADNTVVIPGDWPYPTTKTYDPNGRLERTGQSGPYQTVYYPPGIGLHR